MAIQTIPGATSSDLKTLKGTELADTFKIEGKNQYIDGLAGADTVTAATGIESITIDVGADNDTITLSGEANKVLMNLQGGTDSVTLVDTISTTIDGGDGADTITQGATRTFEGGQVFGRSGNDQFNFVNVSGAYIGGDQDDDTIIVTGKSVKNTIRGGNQKDTITIANSTGGLIKGDKQEDTITISGTTSGLYVGGDSDNDIITINGAASTTTVRGGSGDDDLNINSTKALLVKGDSGKDDIDQGTGNANHTIYGGSGDDAIDASSTKALLIYGDDATEATTDGKDTITLTGVADAGGAHSVYGGGGDDAVVGTTGKEYIEGGAGKDTVTASTGNDTIYSGAGADLIQLVGDTASTNFIIRGGKDNDIFSADSTAFRGLKQDDTLKGDDGTDIFAIVGANAETFDMTVAESADSLSFNNFSGVETFALGYQIGATGTPVTATVDTGDTYKFSTAAQTAGFRTFDAKHTIDANNGTLTIDASKYTSAAPVTINGSDDTNVHITAIGGSGNDTLNDGKAATGTADVLTGGDGIDTFNITSTGVSTSITDLGKGGADIFTVTSGANGATVAVTTDYVATSATVNNKSRAAVVVTTAAGIDANFGAALGSFGFTIGTGGSTAVTLQGSAKQDSITGAAGNDSLIGNGGNDTIVPAAGNDSINAGTGNDSIVFITGEATSGDSIDGGTGTDSINLDNKVATFTSTFDFDKISNLLSMSTSGAGANGADATVVIDAITETGAQTVSITGTSMTNGLGDLIVTNNAASSTTTFNLTGGANADNLAGSNGKDTLNGAAGVDVLNGGTGDDSVVGGSGADTITNTGGNDTVQGGTGIDEFVTTTAGTMQVTDFNVDAIDTVTIGAGTTFTATVLRDTTVAANGDLDNNSTGAANAVFTVVDDKDFDASLQTSTKGVTLTAAGNGNGSELKGTNHAAGNDIITGGEGNDTLLGNGGLDTITAGGGTDTITAGAGADAITFGSGSDAASQTGQATAQSVAWTAEGLTDATLADGETITFGNGLDIYTGWTDGADTFQTGKAAAFTSIDAGGDLEAAAAEGNYGISGSYASATGIFTQADAGADTLVAADIVTGGVLHTDNKTNFFLVLNSATLAAADFT